jgi:NAD(P)-dependent dehydrogenase (short-subunit alcohol dehydrogenase family)
MISQIVPLPKLLPALSSQIVVATGGASGIGLVLNSLLHQYGAHVFFGDASKAAGKDLETKLHTDSASKASGSATFLPCNVTNCSDVYRLFKSAYSKHGRIDHAISRAGILERGNFLTDLRATIDSIVND